jgi:hypothetical protein
MLIAGKNNDRFLIEWKSCGIYDKYYDYMSITGMTMPVPLLDR